jgi:hypothetical protein
VIIVSLRANKTKKSGQLIRETAVSSRVTVSLDTGLLAAVDRYADHVHVSRSAVFEKALMAWYETLQEEADKVFYARESEDPQVRNWSKISAKAIRYLWND